MAQAITTKESEFIANAFLMSTEEQPEEKLDVLAQQFFQDLSQDVRHSSSDQVILLLCQKDGYLQKNPLLGAFLIQKIHEIAGEPKQVDTGATSVHQHFLATASHELKTPLQGLLGAAEIALEIACYGHCARDSMIDLLEKFLPQIQDPILQPDAQDLLKQCAAIRERISEKAEDSLKTIIECADQLNRIINDILNITQMQRGKLQLNKCTFATQIFFTSSQLKLLQKKASEKGLEFNIALDPNLPAHCYSDPVRIQQILTNLIENAIKHTPSGSINIQIIVEKKDAINCKLLIKIEDTGVGIPEDAIGRILLPFEQVHTSSGGTGLGLSIAAHLISLLSDQGQLSITSEINKGSTFSFPLIVEMPPKDSLAHVYAKFHTPPLLSKKPLKFPTTLLIEDNKTNQKVLSHLLSSNRKIELDLAENGIDALIKILAKLGQDASELIRLYQIPEKHPQLIETIKTHLRQITTIPYELLFVDLRMPYLDGAQMIKILNECGIGRGDDYRIQLETVGISGDTYSADTETAFQTLVDELLGKPILKQDLTNTLIKHLKVEEDMPIIMPSTTPLGVIQIHESLYQAFANTLDPNAPEISEIDPQAIIIKILSQYQVPKDEVLTLIDSKQLVTSKKSYSHPLFLEELQNYSFHFFQICPKQTI